MISFRNVICLGNYEAQRQKLLASTSTGSSDQNDPGSAATAGIQDRKRRRPPGGPAAAAVAVNPPANPGVNPLIPVLAAPAPGDGAAGGAVDAAAPGGGVDDDGTSTVDLEGGLHAEE